MLNLSECAEYKERIYAKRILCRKYSPRTLKQKIVCRNKNALLYITSGIYHYTFAGVEFTAESDNIVYLPESASYTYEILSEKTLCMQLEFTLFTDSDDKKESAILCGFPIIAERNAASEFEALFSDLINADKCCSHSADFSSDAVFFVIMSKLFGLLIKNDGNAFPYSSRIKKAVEYIDSNYNEAIEVSYLAQLCNISESQLRRLFKDAFGVSPIKYKNRRRMKEACLLLKSDTMNISEIADAMNFGSVYLFSQAFKKEIGVSPKKYVMENHARFT